MSTSLYPAGDRTALIRSDLDTGQLLDIAAGRRRHGVDRSRTGCPGPGDRFSGDEGAGAEENAE
jgi:hypothetical protein